LGGQHIATSVFACGAIEAIKGDKGEAVKAQMIHCGGRGDADMDLCGPGFKDHFLELFRGGAAHDAVIHEHDAFAFDQRAVDVELEAHAHRADLLGRLDKGAADILVSVDAHGVLDARLLRKANSARNAAIWDGGDKISLYRGFFGELDTNAAAAFIDRLAADDAVGA